MTHVSITYKHLRSLADYHGAVDLLTLHKRLVYFRTRQQGV